MMGYTKAGTQRENPMVFYEYKFQTIFKHFKLLKAKTFLYDVYNAPNHINLHIFLIQLILTF